ncbi:hypothetical protein DZJ_04200 [Dickeya ananatis]
MENNTLAVPAPVPVPGVPVGPGDKVKQDADKNIASGLQGGIDGVADWLDKVTQCSFGRACSSDDAGQESKPNVAGSMTDKEKADLGGVGSGTPGGWGPEDEENSRNSDSSLDPRSRSQYEQYVDSLRASMEKPNVKDDNLKNIINDLYRPNAKVGSGSTADAVRYELATGEKVGGRGHVEKAETYSRALQDWLNKNPQASSSDRAAAENVLKDMQNALKGKK